MPSCSGYAKGLLHRSLQVFSPRSGFQVANKENIYLTTGKSLKIHTALKCACVGRSSVGLHYIEYTLTPLISATELITRYYSNEKLGQCCFNVRPTSATLAGIKPKFGECAVLAG